MKIYNVMPAGNFLLFFNTPLFFHLNLVSLHVERKSSFQILC